MFNCCRIYNNLPEVKKKQEEKQKRIIIQSNRKRVEIFKKVKDFQSIVTVQPLPQTYYIAKQEAESSTFSFYFFLTATAVRPTALA